MAEEAKEPRRDIPRAILSVTVGGGLLFIVLSWAAQVARPSTTFETADSGATEVMTTIGGNTMVLFTAAYVAGAFGSALTSQASVTRIVYAMGRDGTLPRPLGVLAAGGAPRCSPSPWSRSRSPGSRWTSVSSSRS